MKKIATIVLCVAVIVCVASACSYPSWWPWQSGTPDNPMPTFATEPPESEIEELSPSNMDSGRETYGIEAPDPEEYYSENGEILNREDAATSDKAMTETDVVAMLQERGFENMPVEAEVDMAGEYLDEYEIENPTDTKHPTYQTYYFSAAEEMWTIMITGNQITANPVSFNMDSALPAQVIVSESDTLISYDNATNRYYTTIPKESALIVRVVDRITADALDQITTEELRKS